MNNSWLSRLLRLLASVLVAVGALAQGLPEMTIRWTGIEDQRWANPANWSPARIPNGSDHVAIEGATAKVVDLTNI